MRRSRYDAVLENLGQHRLFFVKHLTSRFLCGIIRMKHRVTAVLVRPESVSLSDSDARQRLLLR